MFVSVLEGLHQSQRLVHRAAHRQVIDGDLPQDAFIVNHKQTSVGAGRDRKLSLYGIKPAWPLLN